jgi:hypothetical protein
MLALFKNKFILLHNNVDSLHKQSLVYAKIIIKHTLKSYASH